MRRMPLLLLSGAATGWRDIRFSLVDDAAERGAGASTNPLQ